jgi:6-phosphogluconolactonase/glucosamine-6-phosphate isomerase/deaminase
VNPQQRITFGMPLLCRAKHIFIFITGEKKWDVLNDNSAQLPIHELMGRRNDIKLFYTE